MSDQDIRWTQRFSNYNKALAKLNQTVMQLKNEYTDKDGNIDESRISFDFEIIKEGLIQRFEYTHELAWNVMKDYAYFQGNPEVGGSRDATREALVLHLIENAKVWMEMIASRNKTFHTYDEDTANEIFTKIMNEYHPAFVAFQKVMQDKISSAQLNTLD